MRAQRSEMAQPHWYAIVLTLFVRLICIWRSGNEIEEIPEFFTSLRNLEVLNLSCEFTRYWITWMCTWADRTNETANSIKRIDESFALLQNLKLLYLSGSVFDAFAHAISFAFEMPFVTLRFQDANWDRFHLQSRNPSIWKPFFLTVSRFLLLTSELTCIQAIESRQFPIRLRI